MPIVSSGPASGKEKMLSKDAKMRESSIDFGVNKYGKHKNRQRCAFSLESALRLSQGQESSGGPGVGVGDRRSRAKANRAGHRTPSEGSGEGGGWGGELRVQTGWGWGEHKIAPACPGWLAWKWEAAHIQKV